MSAEITSTNSVSGASSIPANTVRPQAEPPSAKSKVPTKPEVQPEPKVLNKSGGKDGSTPIKRAEISRITERINKVLTVLDKSVRFKVQHDPNQIIVQMVNRKTGEVIRTIPSKAMLSLKKRLDNLVGLLLDENA